MEEQKVDQHVLEETVPPVPPPVQISAAQLDAMKAHLINTLLTHYREFLTKIGNLPGHPHAKAEALRFFDTAYLWYKDSINNMPVTPVTPKAESPQPEAQPQSNEAQAPASTSEAPAVVNDSLPVENPPTA